jgi:hypothetical protein
MQPDSAQVLNTTDTTVLKSLVVNLLREKPADPVPFIYNFLAQTRDGVKDIKPITNIEVSQIKNLRLKLEDLK